MPPEGSFCFDTERSAASDSANKGPAARRWDVSSCKIILGETGTVKWDSAKHFQSRRIQPASSPLGYDGGGRKVRSPCRQTREGTVGLETERSAASDSATWERRLCAAEELVVDKGRTG